MLALLLCSAAPARGQILPQSLRARQSTAANRLLPAALSLRPSDQAAPLTDVAPIRLRIWATRDYRDQTVNWQQHVRVLIGRVNRLTRAWPGVEFEVVEMRPWDFDTANRPLVGVLQDLQAQDPGEDVDCVIGLASALEIVPPSLEALGYARSPGRHFVLRGVSSVSEYNQVRESFDQIDAAQREQLLSARQAHRELVIFLHEWAHTLGALHAVHSSLLMNPSYSHMQTRFDEGNARLIEAVLSAREQGPGAQRVALRKALSQTQEPAWEPQDRARMLESLSHDGPRAPEAPRPAEGPRPSAARAGADGAPAETKGAWGPLRMAEAYLAAGRDQAAVAALTAAEAELGERPDPPGWKALSALWRRARFPSLALRAAGQAGGADAAEVDAWYTGIRRRFAIPENASALGLPPQRERDYILSLETAEAAVSGGRVRLATQLGEQLGRDFPGLPAGPIVQCEVHLSAGRLDAARAACESALHRQEDASAAHLLLALLDLHKGRCAKAQAHADRALALDPSLQAALRPVREQCRK